MFSIDRLAALVYTMDVKKKGGIVMTRLETFSRMLFANNRLLFDDISFFFYDARDVEGETSLSSPLLWPN